jgi:hypothetical protein
MGRSLLCVRFLFLVAAMPLCDLELEKAIFALGAGTDIMDHLVPSTLCEQGNSCF